MQIVDFLRDNWQFVSTVFIDLLIIIVAVIKKKSISVVKDNSCISNLIDLVNLAESKFGSKKGKEKLNYVCEEYLKRIHLNPKLVSMVRPSIENEVDRILSTPQRKEKS